MAFLDGIKKQKQFSTEMSISSIPISEIQPDPNQVRKVFDEEKLKELSDSIKEQGIQNPIHVRTVQKGYVILTGERRYRASKLAGLQNIPCIIHTENMTSQEIRAIQLLENIQRADLNVIERSRGFQELVTEGMSQREISRSLGITEGTVSKSITILKKLPDEWIKQIEELCKKNSVLSLRQVYDVAKEKNKNKKKAAFEKLLGEMIVEEDHVEEEEEKPPKKVDIGDEKEYTVDEIWEALKKTVKKDKNALLTYMTPAKIKKLFSDLEDQ